MVKSETTQDAEILVRNPSPRLFAKKFRDSKKGKTNHAKTRLRDLSKTLPRFRDPAKIFRDSRFSRYHSPPLTYSKHKHKKNGHVHSSFAYAYKHKKNERRMMLLLPSCLCPYAFAYTLEETRLYRFLQNLGNLWYDRLQ